MTQAYTQNCAKNRESGFTLLELLLVIGVAALLLIGGIATYRLVSEGNKTTDTTRLLLTIRQQAQVLAQGQNGNYSGIEYPPAAGGISPFVAAGVLRDAQTNPFNGTIDIEPSGTAGAEENLTITLTNIPRGACAKLFTALTDSTDIVTVGVDPAGGNTTVNFDAAAGEITAANAASSCTGSANSMVWLLR